MLTKQKQLLREIESTHSQFSSTHHTTPPKNNINTFSDRISTVKKRKKEFNLQGTLSSPNVNINDFLSFFTSFSISI